MSGPEPQREEIRRRDDVFNFASLFLGHSAYSADVNVYDGICDAQGALKLIQSTNDQNAILISPVSFDRAQRKVIKINRGSKDYIVQAGDGIDSSWTNATSSGHGNVDFSKKPTDMSFDDFMNESRYTHKKKFFTEFGTHELSIHTQKKKITLTSEQNFEVKNLSDGSQLILLGRPSCQTSFSIVL